MDNVFNIPILFVIFNRPDTTKHVFSQIKILKPKYLFIAADGPRPEKIHEIGLCRETRKIIEEIDWDCELKTLFRDENLGCGLGVCSAISWFFDHVDYGIILEDDCLPNISFFHFCQELLIKYKQESSIYVISGTNLQNGIIHGDSSYYFSNYPITWGWATWKRAWKQFSYDIPDAKESFQSGKLDHVFNSYWEKLYWRKKMEEAETNKKYIWDYQWYYAIWKNNGICIRPNINLITNIGFRNNATHTFLKDSLREPTLSIPIKLPIKHPEIAVNRNADKITFKNAFGYSFKRFVRLTKENGIFVMCKYLLSKWR